MPGVTAFLLQKKAALRALASLSFFLVLAAPRDWPLRDATLPIDAQFSQFKCPVQNASGLQLLKNGGPCNREILVCWGLRLVFLHNYKAAGSSFMQQLEAFCEAASGAHEKLVGWDQHLWTLGGKWSGSPCNPEIICSSPGWTCYSSVRDPIERFLSSYHEIAKRRDSQAFKNIVGELSSADASPTAKLESFQKFLRLSEEYPQFDAHIEPQVAFLPKTLDNVRLFRVEEGEQPLQDFLCGIFACLNGTQKTIDKHDKQTIAACPKVPLRAMRTRRDVAYRVPQYDVSSDELPKEWLQRIMNLYKDDYCSLGYQIRPEADSLECRDPMPGSATSGQVRNAGNTR